MVTNICINALLKKQFCLVSAWLIPANCKILKNCNISDINLRIISKEMDVKDACMRACMYACTHARTRHIYLDYIFLYHKEILTSWLLRKAGCSRRDDYMSTIWDFLVRLHVQNWLQSISNAYLAASIGLHARCAELITTTFANYQYAWLVAASVMCNPGCMYVHVYPYVYRDDAKRVYVR